MRFHLRSAVHRRPDEEKDPDVSPLIDMVFILLIFFIVTTVFVDEIGLELKVPGPPPLEPVPTETESVRLFLGGNGEIRFREEALTLAEVATVVRRHPDAPVLVEVHKDALSGWMVQVADAAQLGGAEVVSVIRAR
jgi:biopolymer transport protein ExbD